MRTIGASILLHVAWVTIAAAQVNSVQPRPVPEPSCGPDARQLPQRPAPPTVGGPDAPDLSDRLAESKGVICPPPTADKDIELRPPPTGDNNVVPAPGTPGSPRLQPK
jgi:hypothetical protein